MEHQAKPIASTKSDDIGSAPASVPESATEMAPASAMDKLKAWLGWEGKEHQAAFPPNVDSSSRETSLLCVGQLPTDSPAATDSLEQCDPGKLVRTFNRSKKFAVFVKLGHFEVW